ncbi:hypothetical protein [Algivirga pacifica]|uniref:Uncharacterized protein n=1 Tax=Algivirga pacifica TaxID=1162670 RepID=A0ABP9DDS9_9BACT
MTKFKDGNLTTEEAFWVMWYFLKEHYDLSEGAFDISDILSASEPVEFNELGHMDGNETGNRRKAPIDNGMISFWNKAIEKFKSEGIPPVKKFKK